MIKVLSKEEYESIFETVYDPNKCVDAFLENGERLCRQNWNGEMYGDSINPETERYTGKEYRPVYKQIDEDEFEVIGYEEVL